MATEQIPKGEGVARDGMGRMDAEWHRVGLERPHFLPLARGQKTIGVAPAQPIGRAVKTFRTDRDAVFSRRAGRTSSFHLVFLNNRGRGEELFTPLLHRGLRQSLHGGRGAMVRQINPMHVPKRTERHADRNDGRAGATPPFDAPWATGLGGSPPPSQVLRANAYCGVASCNAKNLSDKMSDILNDHERRSLLPILKAPPKQPKTVTVQARVEESVKTQLELYAEFIDASPSYVIAEALKLLFRKDDDFRHWADQHTNNHNNEKAKGVLAKVV
jgi:hypothetical protein